MLARACNGKTINIMSYEEEKVMRNWNLEYKERSFVKFTELCWIRRHHIKKLRFWFMSHTFGAAVIFGFA